jgi:hypothetical protein
MARPILQLEATEEEVLELGRLVRGTKVSVGDRLKWLVANQSAFFEAR